MLHFVDTSIGLSSQISEEQLCVFAADQLRKSLCNNADAVLLSSIVKHGSWTAKDDICELIL